MGVNNFNMNIFQMNTKLVHTHMYVDMIFLFTVWRDVNDWIQSFLHPSMAVNNFNMYIFQMNTKLVHTHVCWYDILIYGVEWCKRLDPIVYIPPWV